jgi:hypothetical protein
VLRNRRASAPWVMRCEGTELFSKIEGRGRGCAAVSGDRSIEVDSASIVILEGSSIFYELLWLDRRSLIYAVPVLWSHVWRGIAGYMEESKSRTLINSFW